MFELYPYQTECLEAVDGVRQKSINRALVVMATGLGKTVMAAFDAKKWFAINPGKRLLFLCHQNYILEQARETFEAILGHSFTYGMFTGEEKSLHEVTCLFASFQTMVNYKDFFAPDESGYVIVDESHHSHAEGWREVVRYFEPEFVLGMTATPDRLDEQNIRELFGEEIFSLPLEEALVRGYLTPVDYRLLADEISRSKILETPVGKLSIKHLNRTIFVPKRDEEIAEIIGRNCQDFADPRMIIFCKSIAHCNHFAEFLPSCMAIHSKISAKERAIRLELFRQGILKTVVTVDCFNEGIDIPQANVIVFLRSTDSPTIFLQQLGRGLRKSDGKDKVLVLDFAGNCERVEMVYKLWQKIREKGQALGKVRELSMDESADLPIHGPFMIDVNQVNFSQTIVEILDVVNRIRIGYTREGLIEQLRKEALRLGRTPTLRDIHIGARERRTASVSAFASTFGTWNEALAAADLELNKLASLDYSKETLIEQIKDEARRLGRTPTAGDLNVASAAGRTLSMQVFRGVFGAWNNALVQAGFTKNRIHKYTKKELIAILKAEARRLGRTPISRDMDQQSKVPSTPTFVAAFGSWNAALEKAGLIKTRQVNYSNEELIALLKAEAILLRRTPTYTDIEEASKLRRTPSVPTYKLAFGSFKGALLAAGLEPKEERDFSRETLLAQLKHLKEELDRIPYARDVDRASKQGKCACSFTFRKTFGSWTEVIRCLEEET